MAAARDRTISGDDRYVADYLYRESLMQLPAGDQRFLRCTAVLDQLCAPLGDALLGGSGAQERLRNLEASGRLLVRLDRRREWYRYHGLFREFLLGELRRVEPEIITKLICGRPTGTNPTGRRRWPSSTCCRRANGTDAPSW